MRTEEPPMADITNEPLSDEGARNLEDQLEDAKQQGALWFGLNIRNGDADGLFARLRKAEAERDAERANVEKLRMAMRELRDWLQGSCRADGDSEKAAALALANAALAETEARDA